MWWKPEFFHLRSNDFYDYECKYNEGLSHYECPADLDEIAAIKLKESTELLFKELGCNIYARADYIMDKEGVPYFLEMNTLPGMTSTSLLPKSASADGFSFNQLIKNIIELSFWMEFYVYNTLTRNKELFQTINHGRVKLYTCGPTVYDFSHIGNFRTFIFEDLLKRWLIHLGYEVNHIMNITDVDDKTIAKSIKKKVSLK